MSKKGQIFYRESKLKFYLRNSHSTHPCQIYLVASIDGKRYRIYTRMKVYASQWDQERQLAVISNVQSKQDNRNNKIANNYLNKLRGYFSEFIEYICNNNVDDIAETLKKFINRDMAKKKINLVYVAADALEYYHNYVKPSIKDSTKRQSESLLSEFGRFVDTLREKDKTMEIFSQRGLNMYKEYLIDKMNKSKEDDSRRNFGVGQLNRCGAIIALLINKVLVPQEKAPSPVVWIKVDDPRREDQMGHIPLLDNEVAAIESCSGLTPVEEEYRDVFLLHLECGQRVSDLAKLLTGNYMVKQGKKYKYIVVSTTKENINAIIPITPKVTILMDKIKNHTLVDPKEFEEKTKGKGNNTYNEAIRRIAKKAGLDREIVKIDSTQKEVRKPLYKTLSSHDARCTFITNMIRKGVSPERLCRMTGHANDEMIKRVYAQLTVEDEINRIESDLYSDVDDDETPMEELPSTTIAPQNTAAVHEAKPSPFISDLPNYNPTDAFNPDSYIKGLENATESAQALVEFWSGIDTSKIDQIKERLDDEYNDFLEMVEESCPKSKEEIIELWYNFKQLCEDELDNAPESSEDSIDLVKINFLAALIGYSKENQFGKDVIKKLDGFRNEICEENPAIKLTVSAHSSIKIGIPAMAILAPIIEVILYALYNRPFVDRFSESTNSYSLIRIPDWRLVHRELCKLPPLKLQALIQNTNCPQVVKLALYRSIVSGNVDLFANTIESYDRETYEIIEFAYLVDFVNQMKQKLEKPLEVTGSPNEKIVQVQDFFSFQNPFGNIDIDIFSLVSSDQSEHYLQLIDNGFSLIGQLKKGAYPKEIKIYNRLLRLIDNYPELKAAYEEYKSQEDSESDTKMPDNSKKKPEVEFQNLEIFKSEINLNEMNPKELLPSLSSDIKRLGDELFKEFINYLAHSSCIDDGDAIKQLLVYRFTGACRPEGDLVKIPWNPDKLNELAYVIRYATARGAIGKYEKVRDFFEGPSFPENISMIRTTADNAPLDFRLKLNSLYPDVFTIKGARKKRE